MNRELSQGNYSVAIFYKQKHLFTNMRDSKAKTVHLRLTPVGEWRIRKGWRRVKKLIIIIICCLQETHLID
jgi:hypothetical protein